MDVLHKIFFFILSIGVLVTIHEYGHYWVARKLNIKVLRFSIGFGKPLLKWTRKIGEDTIEYIIAAIPLGGYVKMLDEREGDVDEKDLARSFNRQPLLNRAAVVAAGPVFNFILAIFLYWLVFIIGTAAEKPLLGVPATGTVAESAGFAVRDEVIKVGATEIRSWNQLRIAIIDEGLDGGDVSVTVRDSDGRERPIILALGDKKLLENEGDIVSKLGFRQWRPEQPARIDKVIDDSAAKKAGLKEGDAVIAINGEPIRLWGDMVEVVKLNPGKELKFIIDRLGIQQDINVTPGSRKHDDKEIGFIGAAQYLPEEVSKELRVNIQYGMFEAVPYAVEKTWVMSVLTLRVLWKMVVGDASLANISGPVTIATYAGITAQIGLSTFLGFLAIISVSLGVLNFLPIPMLDGGHLFYYLIELVKGSPVSEFFEIQAQKVGLVILAILMCIAFFNDYQRLMQ